MQISFLGGNFYSDHSFSDKFNVWRVKKLHKFSSNDYINAYVILSAIILIFYISARQKPYHLIGGSPMGVLSQGNFVPFNNCSFISHTHEWDFRCHKLGLCRCFCQRSHSLPTQLLCFSLSILRPSPCRCSMADWHGNDTLSQVRYLPHIDATQIKALNLS